MLTIIFCGLLPVTVFCQGQKDESQRLLISSATEQQGYDSAGIEAYLVGRTLEVIVEARTSGGKPFIKDTFLEGPKLDRLVPKVNRTAYAGEVENVLLPREKFGGTLSRNFYKFVIPADKILPGGDYKIIVIVEKMQEIAFPKKFSFKLEKLPELILQQKQE